MSSVTEALCQISKDLDAMGRGWALIGGLAVSARAEPRMTRDVDIAVAVSDDEDAEGLIFSLQSRGYRVMLALEQAAVGRLSTVRLEAPGRGTQRVLVDLLFASSGIEPEVVAGAERLEILAGFEAPVARIGHLIALKVLARDDRRRPQDWDDIRALLSEAKPTDIDDASAALRLIEQRGFHRDKALGASLEEMMREPR